MVTTTAGRSFVTREYRQVSSARPPGYAGMNYIDVAHELTKQIPEGRWTSYGELADAVFAITGDRRTGYAIAIKLLQREHAPWHRLRDRHGVYKSPSSRPAAERDEWQSRRDEALRAEGCSVGERTRQADPARFISARELIAVLGPPVDPLEEARRKDPDLSARVAAKRAARRAERGW
jgi:alkylated DNA nucleotide flippase Atl1